MPKYTLAVSTLDDGILNYRLPDIHRIDDISILIIHQISNNKKDFDYSISYSKLKEKKETIEIIKSDQLGLSKSRNLAINNSKTPYIIFSDDDNSYSSDLIDILDRITSRFKLQIYSFRIVTQDGEPFKLYPDTEIKHNNRSILRLSSIENVYDLDFIKKNKILFNEDFGLGSKYPSCEQPIFAKDILDNKGEGCFFPIDIAIHPKENSGDNYYQPIQAQTRKKMFLNIYGKKGWVFIFAFYLKKLKSVPLKSQLPFFYGLFIK
ncbi:TPA: hypothetical protein U2I44_003753 [Providencia rettgeri]|nr:hypothetical protein [Providencia rettgeri]